MTFIKRHITHQISDPDLIRKYQESNDAQCISDLYQRYLELVYGVCLKYLGDGEVSKDATMEIYEVLLAKLKDLTVENFKSWLYVVVKNHCLQIIRKQKYHTIRLSQEEIMHSAELLHHDKEFDIVDPHQDLNGCIEKLPEAQRKSILWFYYEKKSYEEIALIMEVSKDQVRSNIQNGRRNLKNCMKGKDNGQS